MPFIGVDELHTKPETKTNCQMAHGEQATAERAESSQGPGWLCLKHSLGIGQPVQRAPNPKAEHCRLISDEPNYPANKIHSIGNYICS